MHPAAAHRMEVSVPTVCTEPWVSLRDGRRMCEQCPPEFPVNQAGIRSLAVDLREECVCSRVDRIDGLPTGKSPTASRAAQAPGTITLLAAAPATSCAAPPPSGPASLPLREWRGILFRHPRGKFPPSRQSGRCAFSSDARAGCRPARGRTCFRRGRSRAGSFRACPRFPGQSRRQSRPLPLPGPQRLPDRAARADPPGAPVRFFSAYDRLSHHRLAYEARRSFSFLSREAISRFMYGSDRPSRLITNSHPTMWPLRQRGITRSR
jgi:hypothetical protein